MVTLCPAEYLPEPSIGIPFGSDRIVNLYSCIPTVVGTKTVVVERRFTVWVTVGVIVVPEVIMLVRVYIAVSVDVTDRVEVSVRIMVVHSVEVTVLVTVTVLAYACSFACAKKETTMRSTRDWAKTAFLMSRLDSHSRILMCGKSGRSLRQRPLSLPFPGNQNRAATTVDVPTINHDNGFKITPTDPWIVVVTVGERTVEVVKPVSVRVTVTGFVVTVFWAVE